MAVPYTFANATTSIPLSQLDSNFATTTTFGNTAVTLGDTVTTLNNMTLANVTVSSGNVTITSGNRITGDFSGAFATRVALQSSTVNGNTVLNFFPNGTGNSTTLVLSNNSSGTSGSELQMSMSPTDGRISSSRRTGSDTYLPILFYTSNGEAMRIDANRNVGIGTTSADASAILDAQSTTKGVRFPNMTTTQKNAVATPPAGLVVFDTTLSKLCVYSGVAWQTITSV